MSFYTPGFLHKPAPPPGGGVTSISYITSQYTDDSNTAVIPATAQIGDFLLFTDEMNGSGTPTDVTPAGWTKIITLAVSSSSRYSIYCKICASGDPGKTISDSLTATTPSSVKRISVFRGDAAITAFVLSTVNNQWTASAPTNQTVSASGQTVPLIVFAQYVANLNVTTRGFSPAADASLAPEDPFVDWLLYKIYNSSPANHTISMADYGSRNTLYSFYVKLS